MGRKKKDVAVVTQAMNGGLLTWGFKCELGFAPFGTLPGAEPAAKDAADQYNHGDTYWTYVPLEGEVA